MSFRQSGGSLDTVDRPTGLDERDLESNKTLSDHLINDTIHSLGWRDVTVTVKDRQTKEPVPILSAADGLVKAGQLLALMGPSGSGKTTLLNVLAHRVPASYSIPAGEVLVNHQPTSRTKLGQISSYVEQEDSLIGSLTVRETIDFAARLTLPTNISKRDRSFRVDDQVSSFGMEKQAQAIVGTAVRKGISGGQKRRLSVASQLVTSPKILFLDEPTSGLDSVASYEVMNHIQNLAQRYRLIVVASIHQPSTTTFQLFDQVMLLSEGKTCYFGPSASVQAYFGRIGYPLPNHINPAEFLLELVNTDFPRGQSQAQDRLGKIQTAWGNALEARGIKSEMRASAQRGDRDLCDAASSISTGHTPTRSFIPLILLHRNWIKSHRDVVVYGIRIAMYLGLAIMMGEPT